MNFRPIKSASLLIPSGPITDPDKMHLFFICTNKCDADQVLLVNLTSIRDGVPHDNTCEINVGDHRWVKEPSYIKYDRAQIFDVDTIGNQIAAGKFIPQNLTVPAVMRRICAGIMASPLTPLKYQNYYNLNKDR